MTSPVKAYRAAILHSIADPAVVGVEQSYEYFEDGLLVIDNGQVANVGPAADLLPTLKGVEITEYRDALITPGFIDTHIHYPQTGMIASYGEQLLDWLNTYTFPTEQQFADKAHACGCGRHLPQGVAAQRHHHRPGVRQRAQAIGRRLLRGRRSAEPAHDRRQGADGPQRPGLPDRHRRDPATPTARS